MHHYKAYPLSLCFSICMAVYLNFTKLLMRYVCMVRRNLLHNSLLLFIFRTNLEETK